MIHIHLYIGSMLFSESGGNDIRQVLIML